METKTVKAHLEAEHERIDEMLLMLGKIFATGSVTAARRAFASLTRALFRHIDAEERALFPSIEGPDGAHRGLTAIMRLEHVQLRSRIVVVSRSLASGDLAKATDDLAELQSFLESHNKKEELVLCPTVDAALASAEARATLLGRMIVISKDSDAA